MFGTHCLRINADVKDDWTLSKCYLGIFNHFCIPFLVSGRDSKKFTSCKMENHHICRVLVVRGLTIILLVGDKKNGPMEVPILVRLIFARCGRT